MKTNTLNIFSPSENDLKEGSQTPNNIKKLTIGDEIKKQRTAQNFSIADVAQSLRISEIYLNAIEENNFQLLPERVYTLGFVRSYAHFLSMNTDYVMKRFKAEILGDTQQQTLNFLKPDTEQKVPSKSVIWLSMTAALTIIVCGYFLFNKTTDHNNEATQETKVSANASSTTQNAAFKTSDVSPTSPSVESSQRVADHHVPQSTPVAESKKETASEQPSIKPVAQANTTVEPVTEPATQKVLPVQTQPDMNTISLTAQLAFSEETWVEIKDPQGKVIIRKTFLPTETYSVPQGQFVMNTGNAGGIMIKLNGHKEKALGVHGEVLKNISLDPKALLSYLKIK